MKWEIIYTNDTGPTDDSYYEWWEVTNDVMGFKCDNQEHAEWLCNILNNLPV